MVWLTNERLGDLNSSYGNCLELLPLHTLTHYTGELNPDHCTG